MAKSTSAEVEDPDSQPTEPARPRRRGRLAGVVAGTALVLAGLGMLGYAGWQYIGTDIVSRRTQSELTQEIRERWQQPTVGDILGPQSPTTQGTVEGLIRVPRFGDDFEVPLIEGVRDEDLAQGIGQFAGAGPGQIGNFALAGHRVTYGEPFHDLPQLRPGDAIVVETSDTTYTYVLDTDPNDLVVPFTQGWVIDPVPVPPAGEAPPGMPAFETPNAPTEAIITLTTSSEPFHTDDRLVAFGRLVASTPK